MRDPRWRAMAFACLITSTACSRKMPTEAFGLECIYDFRTNVTECPRITAQASMPLSATDSSELVLRAVDATREGSRLTLDIQLAGPFHNEPDQNVYVFLGRPGAAKYTITADPSFAADLAYPVRTEVDLPHTNDVRIGVMAPTLVPHSPQLYVTDAVHTDAVGAATGIVQKVSGRILHLEIPLDRAWAFAKAAVPERLVVTVATARDYVGFVDQLTVADLGVTSTRQQTARDLPPMKYPTLDARSHRFERVAIRTGSSGIGVEVDMALPIVDWAQTNLYFLFVPVPPLSSSEPLFDPSKQRQLPHPWSYYCAVYSPHRLFCKASHGKDFTYDTAYSERANLPAPNDVSFRETAPGHYVLELGANVTPELSASKSTFGLLVSAGRDGFGPTNAYGVSENK